MKTLIAASAFLILAGCTEAPAPVIVADNREADAKSIKAVEEAVGKGWESRNADIIASAYASDASLIIPNMPTVKGSDVSKGMKEMFADPQLTLKFNNTKVEVAKSGDIGVTQGTYEMTMSDPKTKKVLVEKGRYVTVFGKQADGSWKIVQDINAADAPASPK